ncbi:MAG: T9SS type A sorting domain-containing protein [Cytophagaceae bacterium]
MKPLLFTFLLVFYVNYSFSQGGASCETATVVTAGIQSADNSEGAQWFTYTNEAPAPTFVKLSSCGFTSEDTYFSVTRECGTVGFAGSNDACSLQSEAEFIVEAHETIYIVWFDNHTSGSYYWELSESPVEEGDICAMPLAIVEGENVANKSGKGQWYIYTNNGEEDEVITFIGEMSGYVELYMGCGYFIKGSHYQIDHHITPGETVIAYWEGSDEWQFTSRNPSEGDLCELAMDLDPGLNIPDYFQSRQWFSFTNSGEEEKVLEFSVDEFQYLYLYEECGGGVVSWKIGKVSYIAAPGQTVYVLCSYTEGLTLLVRGIEPGDNCSNPIIAQEGINLNANLGMDIWYSYTNSADTDLEVKVATNESAYIRVYSGCNSSILQTRAYNFTHDLAPGETVYFVMEQTEIFSIDIGNVLRGETCEDAIPAQFGKNYPDKVQHVQWFTYTNESDGIEYINIENDRYFMNSIAFLTDCSQDVSLRGYGGVAELAPGASFYLHWFNVSSWTMTLIEPQDGDFCSKPKDIALGTNQADNSRGNQWFVYTNETGEVQAATISSCGLTEADTYVLVYDACGGNKLAESDQFCGSQSQLEYNVQPGETIYVRWSDAYTTNSFQWIFGIDDPAPTSLFEFADNAFKVYPTISEGEYTFSNAVDVVEVYNTMGVLITRKESTSSLDIRNQPQGTYILKILSGDVFVSAKVIKY